MRLLVATAITLSLVSWAASAQTQQWIDPSPHHVVRVAVAPDVDLEVLDWGGDGPPLVLLGGLGNTAHVFDEFAQPFTSKFHVLAVTRRGFGASSHPTAGYDIATLAHDVVMVVDHLGLGRVTLVGHSIAGDEMTKFAVDYPDRVTALVYLDAAYDRTIPLPPLEQPDQPKITGDDFSSIEKFRTWFVHNVGPVAPEAETRATRQIAPDGRVLASTASPDAATQITHGLQRPAYAGVHAPALAIYASEDDIRDAFPGYDAFDAQSKVRADRLAEIQKGIVATSIAAFQSEVQNGHVVRLTAGGHYFFLTAQSETVRLIQEFLTKGR